MLNETQILINWGKFIENINNFISGERQKKLISFYEKYEDRFALATCSGNKAYHNCFPGGYIDHVNRVVDLALKFSKIWSGNGSNVDFTDEELVFVAINHDLGKFGDEEHDLYIPQDSEWHRKNRGDEYKHNPEVPLMHPSDRSLYILQKIGVPMTYNEFVGIRLHDGLYEESNKYYYISYSGERRLKTNLPYIISQADLAAARIEYDIAHPASSKLKDSKFNHVPGKKDKHDKSESKLINEKPSSKALSNFFKK